ncbi:hypothetical protein BJF83_04015 [Nocardiopsis sp. CNR-923]|uniref:hypothetical protein n=1 Tax=Nocardiopsis sp. CNR-923 TaxID=1904965 RepID=UPI000965E64C|nr:hypothetical protein [Nocardiopsis sp. CNR-923]OLT26053.1 hypothetical protein BJF83_04015 [Nocardiopsis sp. CNR-923]
MSKWAGTSAKAMLLAAGFVALGTGVAFADGDIATSGNGSIAGGNQLVVDGDVPVNVCGNSIGAVLGVSGASCTGGTAAVIEGDRSIATSGNGSILGGNQAVVDGDIPVNLSGNAIGALGGMAGAQATDTTALVSQRGGRGGRDGDSIASSGNGSILGGNQLVGDLDVPVNVSGNAIGAVGGVAGAAATDTNAIVHDAADRRDRRDRRDRDDRSDPDDRSDRDDRDEYGYDGYRSHQAAPAEVSTMDLVGEAARNVHVLPDTSGVDAGVLRQSAPAEREHMSQPDIASSGNGSVLGGNQAVVDLAVPVDLSGNAIGAVGGVAGAAATDTRAIVEDDNDVATSGNGSLLGGNQAVVDGDVPVNVTGNAVGAVLGTAGASSTDTGSEVRRMSAPVEHQSGVLDAAPVLHELPEVPLSQMVPVGYDLSETTTQTVETHAPERADELPEASAMPSVDPVGQLLGVAGVGL